MVARKETTRRRATGGPIERAIDVDAYVVMGLSDAACLRTEGLEDFDRRCDRLGGRLIEADDVVVIGRDPDRGGFAVSEGLDLGEDLVKLVTVAPGKLRYAVTGVFRPVECVAIGTVARIII